MAKFGSPDAPPRGPGGRHKKVEGVEDAARSHTALAMKTLATICGSAKAPAAARVGAASVLLDRGWGKARQDHQLRITLDPSKMSDADLANVIANGAAVLDQDEAAAVH